MSFARVDIGVIELPTKTAEIETEKKMGLRFVFQKWACAYPVLGFQWGIYIFLAAEKLTFLGGGITAKLARP